MGKLGLELSDSTWLSNSKAKSTDAKPVLMIGQLPEEKPQDSAADNIIAYVSYYMLVFVAFCAFLPGETAYALGYTKHVIYSTVTPDSPAKAPAKPEVDPNLGSTWELRISK